MVGEIELGVMCWELDDSGSVLTVTGVVDVLWEVLWVVEVIVVFGVAVVDGKMDRMKVKCVDWLIFVVGLYDDLTASDGGFVSFVVAALVTVISGAWVPFVFTAAGPVVVTLGSIIVVSFLTVELSDAGVVSHIVVCSGNGAEVWGRSWISGVPYSLVYTSSGGKGGGRGGVRGKGFNLGTSNSSITWTLTCGRVVLVMGTVVVVVVVTRGKQKRISKSYRKWLDHLWIKIMSH